MADDPIDELRLSVMQNLLPVGLAMVERARKGGPKNVVEVFTRSSDPFLELREEGEPAAQFFRDRLDQVSPGLGNPVISVNVSVEDVENSDDAIRLDEDTESLVHVLGQIESRLETLEGFLKTTADQRSTIAMDD